MELISKLIKEQLEHHRFVVVPSVGAFLLKREPARIDSTRNTILPPKDEVRFNARVSEDDGSLAAIYSRSEGVSFDDAGKAVAQFSEKVKFLLGTEGKVNFPSLGDLTKMPDGSLRFSEDAGMTDWPAHFGLKPVRAVATIKEPTRIKTLVESGKKLPGDTQKLKKVLSYAAVGLIAISLAGLPLTNEHNRHIAALSIGSVFGKKVETKYVPRDFVPLETTAAYESPVAQVENPVIEEEVVKSSPTESPVVEATQAIKYFVIAGRFTSKKGADAFMHDLSSRGFGGLYVGEFDGQHLVSYGEYASLETAEGMRNSVKLGNPDAWVLADS